MNRLRTLVIGCIVLIAATLVLAGETPERRTWTIDGAEREALVSAPDTATSQPTPVVFVFHGHGGTMGAMAGRYTITKRWPEAVAVYPQGLNTPGKLTDLEGKRPGWQMEAGLHGDRDLRFFDATLSSLKQEYQIDERRIFSTGHSNGAGFTYLLWSERHDVLAAVAPTAGAAGLLLRPSLKPKPAFILAGENDNLVKYEWQTSTIDFVRELNGCGEGEPCGKYCTRYPSKVDAPLVTYIHPGAHGFPRGPEAVDAIVKFFRETVKP